MKLTSVKVRYQDYDIELELTGCADHFKYGLFQFSSCMPLNHIELRENKNSTFMESFYQRLSKILVRNSSYRIYVLKFKTYFIKMVKKF